MIAAKKGRTILNAKSFGALFLALMLLGCSGDPELEEICIGLEQSINKDLAVLEEYRETGNKQTVRLIESQINYLKSLRKDISNNCSYKPAALAYKKELLKKSENFNAALKAVTPPLLTERVPEFDNIVCDGWIDRGAGTAIQNRCIVRNASNTRVRSGMYTVKYYDTNGVTLGMTHLHNLDLQPGESGHVEIRLMTPRESVGFVEILRK